MHKRRLTVGMQIPFIVGFSGGAHGGSHAERARQRRTQRVPWEQSEHARVARKQAT